MESLKTDILRVLQRFPGGCDYGNLGFHYRNIYGRQLPSVSILDILDFGGKVAVVVTHKGGVKWQLQRFLPSAEPMTHQQQPPHSEAGQMESLKTDILRILQCFPGGCDYDNLAFCYRTNCGRELPSVQILESLDFGGKVAEWSTKRGVKWQLQSFITSEPMTHQQPHSGQRERSVSTSSQPRRPPSRESRKLYTPPHVRLAQSQSEADPIRSKVAPMTPSRLVDCLSEWIPPIKSPQPRLSQPNPPASMADWFKWNKIVVDNDKQPGKTNAEELDQQLSTQDHIKSEEELAIVEEMKWNGNLLVSPCVKGPVENLSADLIQFSDGPEVNSISGGRKSENLLAEADQIGSDPNGISEESHLLSAEMNDLIISVSPTPAKLRMEPSPTSTDDGYNGSIGYQPSHNGVAIQPYHIVLTPDQQLDVTITVIEGPECFHVQPADFTAKFLVAIEAQMAQFYGDSPQPNTVDLGSAQPFCAVNLFNNAIGYNKWLRGYLVREAKDQAEVFLIDSGEVVNVRTSDIRPIDNRFTWLPMQAFKCSISGVSSSHSDLRRLGRKFEEIVDVGQQCRMEIVSSRMADANPTSPSIPVLEVLLFTKKSSVSVNQQLLE